jgi:hypothetical protein
LLTLLRFESREQTVYALSDFQGSKESHLFEKFRDIYFMYDLDENNRKRYPVTYEEAESYVTNRCTLI